jgi:hypothetical protein
MSKPMYEHHTRPLLPRNQYYARVAWSFGVGSLILAGSLAIGMAGYHWLEQMPWIDAFANAAMILSGMGPLTPIQTPAGKVFAGCYALFSGLAFITSVGVGFAPVIHRFLHKFHLQDVWEPDRRRK